MTQHDEVVTTATAVFGTRRATWSDTEIVAPTVAPARDLPRADLSGLIAWVDNYDLRFIEGGVAPVAEEAPTASATTVWVRDDPGRTLDYPALAAMSDVFFPRPLRLASYGRTHNAPATHQVDGTGTNWPGPLVLAASMFTHPCWRAAQMRCLSADLD